jgi:hypothetical protein
MLHRYEAEDVAEHSDDDERQPPGAVSLDVVECFGRLDEGIDDTLELREMRRILVIGKGTGGIRHRAAPLREIEHISQPRYLTRLYPSRKAALLL